MTPDAQPKRAAFGASTLGEATQAESSRQRFPGHQRVVGDTTLVAIDVAMAMFKQRPKAVERLLDGEAVLLVDDGKVLEDRMRNPAFVTP